MGRHYVSASLGLLFGCLLCAGITLGRVPGEGGIFVTQGSTDLGSTGELDLDATDFSCTTQATGAVSCTLGANVTELGSCIGETTDFCPTVDLSAAATPYLYGGTATSSTLDIRASSASGYTGAISIGGGTITVSSGNFTLVNWLPDGMSWASSGVADALQVFRVGSTVTQTATAGAAASATFFSYAPTYVTGTGTAVTTFPILAAYYSGPTIRNGSASTAVTSGSLAAFYSNPLFSSAGGSTTLSAVYGHRATGQAVGTNVTITDYYVGARVDAPALAGTVTRMWGYYVAAMTSGTARFPYAAGEHTITGTVNSGDGVWGVESGAPNRFYFKNESGHIWRTGWASAIGGCSSGLTSATRYCPWDGFAAANATETNVDQATPGATTFYAIACGLNLAPDNGGGTQSYTITLREGAVGARAGSTLACTISETATSCNDRDETGVTVAALEHLNYEVTVSGTPAAGSSELTCVAYFNVAAF